MERVRGTARRGAIASFIEKITSWVSRNFQLAVIILLGLVAFWLWVLPLWEYWLPWVGYGILLLFQIAFAIFFVIIQFVAIFWFLGRARVYWLEPGESGIDFSDVRGMPEIVEVAHRIVTLLRGVRHFKEMGGEVARGILFVGAPGTGKSYLAQAIATEAGVPFCYASAPSFQNMFFGISNLRIMMLYGKARGKARQFGACIVFIDEIDAIGGQRAAQPGLGGMLGGLFGGSMGLLNELLLQMDPPRIDYSWKDKLLRKLGLRVSAPERPAVLTIGATNIPEILDQALLRPGRFDRKVLIDLPDFDGRKDIIQYYLDKVRRVPDMPLDKMAYDTIGYTPVAIKYVINEAVVIAHFDGRDEITYDDLTRAREVHEWGLRQPIKSMSHEEKRRIAYHEAGHALAQILLPPRERMTKVTIIRHGQALGLAATKPKEEQYTRSREELLADIQVALASRASEELFLGTSLTGVTEDLAMATRAAAAYTSWFGMNGSLYSTRAFNEMAPDSRLKRQIEKLLDEQYKRVKETLNDHRDELVALAEALLERNELDEDDALEVLEQVKRSKQAAFVKEEGVPSLGQPGEPRQPDTIPKPDGSA